MNRLETGMTQPGYSYGLDGKPEPLCPRDDKIMRYEASGLPSGTDNRPDYHCFQRSLNQ